MMIKEEMFINKLLGLLKRSLKGTENKTLKFGENDIEFFSIVENTTNYSIMVGKVNVIVYKDVTNGFYIVVYKNPFVSNGLDKHGTIEYNHKTGRIKTNWKDY